MASMSHGLLANRVRTLTVCSIPAIYNAGINVRAYLLCSKQCQNNVAEPSTIPIYYSTTVYDNYTTETSVDI